MVRRPVFIPSFLSSGRTEICSEQEADLRERKMVDNWSNVAHEAATGYTNVKFIDFESFFCKNGNCRVKSCSDPVHKKGSYSANT